MKFGMRKPSIKKALKLELLVKQKEKLKKSLFLDMGKRAWDI